MSLSHRARGLGVLALVVAVVGGVAVVARGGRAGSGPDEDALLQARSSALRNRLDLARNDRIFLLLEPDRGQLNLYRGGTLLRSFPVLSVEAGERRVQVGRGAARPDWRSTRWEEPRLEPAVYRTREVIESDSADAPDLTGAVDWIPPTPEESVPTPPRFVIHFAEGLGVEVVAEGVDSAAARAGLGARLMHRARHLLPDNWDRYRVRIVMEAQMAGHLYRSLPDSVAFVAVLPAR